MKTIQELTSRISALGLKLDKEPFHLNIVCIRNSDVFTNKFDDDIYWFWYNEKRELGFKTAKITTKAGSFYVKNPINKDGTGVLKTGQHIDCWKKGLHHGEYEALVQAKTLKVWRDKDKDNRITKSQEQEGLFGINVHRASKNNSSDNIDRWSAACIVFQNPLVFKSFMRAVDQQIVQAKKTSFTVSVLDKF